MSDNLKNRIKYEQAKIILRELFKKGLISEDEYIKIDVRCAEACR